MIGLWWASREYLMEIAKETREREEDEPISILREWAEGLGGAGLWVAVKVNVVRI